MTSKDALLESLIAPLTARGEESLTDDMALSWLKILRKFAPLIGTYSTQLMFERSLDANRAAFSWLPALVLPMSSDKAVEQLHNSMAARPPADTLAAHRALLATLIDLLSTLIGARLTAQFLHAAMHADAASSPNEETLG